MLRWILIFLDDIKGKRIVRFCASDRWNGIHRRNYRLLGLCRHVATCWLRSLLWIWSVITFCLRSLLCWYWTFSHRFLVIWWSITCNLGFRLLNFWIAWWLRLFLSLRKALCLSFLRRSFLISRLFLSLQLTRSSLTLFLICRFRLCLINLLWKSN